jgi:hypothetical protein
MRLQAFGGALVASVGLWSYGPSAVAATPQRLPEQLDLNELVPVRDPQGREVRLSRQQIFQKLDANARARTKRGRSLTVQEYFDRIIEIEKKTGQPIRAVPHKGALHEPTSKAIEAQKVAYKAELTALAQGGQVVSPPAPGPAPATRSRARNSIDRAIDVGPAGLLGPVEADFGPHDFGDHGTFAAYTQFKFVDSGGASSVDCSGSFEAGVWVFGHQEPIAKASLVGDATGASTTGTATLDIVGLDPITRSVTLAAPFTYHHEWDTPKFDQSFPILAGVFSVEVKAGAHAIFDLTVAAGGTQNARARTCGGSITPHLVVAGSASAQIDFGIPDVVDIADGGIRADLTLADVQIPTTGSVGFTTMPAPGMSESLNSSVKASFLKGDLVAYVDIDNPCWDIPFVGNVCALSLVGLTSSHYERTLFDEAGFTYDQQLAAVNNRQSGGGLPPAQTAR